MTISGYIQIAILVLAVLLFWKLWYTPETDEGDAGLGDAMVKILGYAIFCWMLVIDIIWFAVQHIQFR